MTEESKERMRIITCLAWTLMVCMTTAALEIWLYRLGLYSTAGLSNWLLLAAILATMARSLQVFWPNRRNRAARELFLAGTGGLWLTLLFVTSMLRALSSAHH